MLRLGSFAVAVATAAAYDNGAANARLPPMGWSSWIALGPGASPPIFDYCDEFSVKQSIDALVALGLDKLGYKHVHLDDCWAGGRNGTGYLYPETDHFPNGMKVVADYTHSKNLSFGVYTCAGTFTCVGGRPGSKDHWEQDAAVFAEYGLDWVKMDWCFTDGMVPQEAYGNMSAALNATGHALSLNMCEWGVANPWEWGDAVAQSWRMAGDHTGVWSSTKSTIAASAAIPTQYTGRPYGWNDMDMLETGCGFGPGMNPGCAHANNRQANMTDVEFKTEFSMWAISASPLIFTSPIMNCTSTAPPPATCDVELVQQLSLSQCKQGASFGCWAANNTMWTDAGCRGVFTCNGQNVTCDEDGAGQHTCSCAPTDANVTCVPWISPVQDEILRNTEVIAINQDVTPQGTPVTPGDLSVWARKLSDGSIAVALYNQNDAPAVMSVDFVAVGFPAGTTASVRDLWAHQTVGTFTGRYPASGGVTVAPHATTLLRLTPQ